MSHGIRICAEAKYETLVRLLTLCEVCAPEYWTAEVARAFADANEPTGSGTPWKLRAGAFGRAKCLDKPGFVHTTLDA